MSEHFCSPGTTVTSDTSKKPLPIRDHVTLRDALSVTDCRVLLASYVQLTGDESLLEAFAPHIGNPFMPPREVPDELLVQLRESLFELLTQNNPPSERVLSTESLKRVMSTLVAEEVGDEFIPMLVEQMGFEYASGGLELPPLQTPRTNFKVLIIGAGLSSIIAAVKLAEAGYDYEILEKGEMLGGVWSQNVYPGVGVDTPSHIYSFSFALNPDWPRYFSSGTNVLEYLKASAERFGITRRIRFNTEAKSCVFDESSGLWRTTVRGEDGSEEVIDANVLINAAGMFTHPQILDVPGLEGFKGKVLHTAKWDDSLDLKGKRVALIGTGASAIQVGPCIAPDVASLTVFQRTAPWLVVNPTARSEVPEGMKWSMRHVPHVNQWYRFLTYWWASDAGYPCVKVDPNWPDQHRSVSAASEGFRQMLEYGIQQELGDRPDLIEKVTPTYPVFGKRVCQEFGWYGMLKRPNVELVTDAIDHMTSTGIVTNDGKEYPLDVVVMATGFGMAKVSQHFSITGRNGVTLREAWGDEELRSHRGVAVPDFPNMFLLVGPNGAPNHGGGVNFTVEAEINYIMRCLNLVFAKGGKTIEVKRQAHDAYNELVDEALRNRVWNHPTVTSYYLNKKRRNFVSFPWRIVDHWQMMRSPEPQEFDVK